MTFTGPSAARSLHRVVPLAALLVAGSAPRGAQGFEGADFQRARDAYFEQQRAYPFGRIPAGAMERAHRAMLRTPSRPSGNLSPLGNWSPLGPSGLFLSDGFFSSSPQTDAGRVDAIAIHPTLGSTLFLASPGGGV